MPPQIEHYKLVKAESIDDLEKIVNNYIEQGYQLYGHLSSNSYWRYIQAVVKYKPQGLHLCQEN